MGNSFVTGLVAKCKALTWKDVNNWFCGLTTLLDRHLAFVLTWIVLFCIYGFLPQISRIWLDVPVQLLLKGYFWFFVFLFGILAFHVYAWWAVLPQAAATPPLTRRQKVAAYLKAPPGWFVQAATWLIGSCPLMGLIVGPLLFVLGLVLLFAFDPAKGDWYPLALTTWVQLGALVLLTGVWLWVYGWYAWFSATSTPGLVAEVAGRVLALLWFATVAGEGFWAFAYWLGEWGSYRLYTIGALFHVGLVLLLAARVIDVVHVVSGWPIRQAIAAALLLVVAWANLISPWPPSSEVGTSAARENLAELKDLPHADSRPSWYDHLKARIEAVPNNGPVVIVAASGGGSRAAVFASLVLEALDREPFLDSQGQPTGQTWGQRIVLLSSVSGGSLATADFVAPSKYVRQVQSQVQAGQLDNQKGLLNSNAAELGSRISDQAAYLQGVYVAMYQAFDPPNAHKAKDTFATGALTKVLGFSRQDALKKENTEPLAWMLYSPTVDDMCGDFMAPLVRGALTPRIDRGASLSRYWENRFDWKDCSNQSGYGAGAYKGLDKRPLVLFNTCDAREGTRRVVGFPPLPRRGLTLVTAGAANDTIDAEPAGRYRGRTLTDFSPGYRLSLAEAVRVSSNFPWGLPIARLTKNALTVPEKMHDNAIRQLLPAKKDEIAKSQQELIGLIPEAKDHILTLGNSGELLEQRQVHLDGIVQALYDLRADAGAPEKSRQGAAKWLGLLSKEQCLAWTTIPLDLTDGGVNENTGMATLCEVIEHLNSLAILNNQPKQKEKVAKLVSSATLKTADAIMNELRRRDVVVVEIDSGAKQTLIEVGPLPAPLRALNNASYATAFTDKDRYLDRLTELLAPPRDQLPAAIQSEYDKSFKGQYARQAMYQRFTCNHAQNDDVMTAWALTPKDKAHILATFYFEYRLWKAYDYDQMRGLWGPRKKLREQLDHVSQAGGRLDQMDPEDQRKFATDVQQTLKGLDDYHHKLVEATRPKVDLGAGVKDQIIEQHLGPAKVR
jgi:hypothetical protein